VDRDERARIVEVERQVLRDVEQPRADEAGWDGPQRRAFEAVGPDARAPRFDGEDGQRQANGQRGE
jgi:hypothetical protein